MYFPWAALRTRILIVFQCDKFTVPLDVIVWTGCLSKCLIAKNKIVGLGKLRV